LIFKKITTNLIHGKARDNIVAACLLFHRISEGSNYELGPDVNCCITLQEFENLILALLENFSPISLEKLLSCMRENIRLPNNAVILTFDDGYYDTWNSAFPILTKYKVPATVYITTGFVNNEIVNCEYQLSYWLKMQDEVNLEWEGKTYHWEFHNHEEREACYLAIKGLIKPINPLKRMELLGRVMRDKAMHPTYSDLFMNWDHVIELGHSPLITIGAHTHSHPLLTSLNSQEMVAEIESSKNILEGKLGVSVVHFSYPYGAVNEEIKNHLRISGFISGVTTLRGAISDYGVDVMAIPRIEISREKLTGSRTLQELID
jgi:peptidoglycan/xylan/chitin deacetylase (PgdA/CDA1 family)